MAGRDDEAEAEAATLVQASTPAPERGGVRGEVAGTMVGRYCLVERLGAGAMGVVWSAQDPQLDRRVAIKLVHPNLSRSPEAAQRLTREARALAKVSHRAVVTIHDAGDVDGQLFIAMELVEGTNLGTMLKTRDAAELGDWQKWLDIMLDAGRGLVAAHRAGVLHRDFKPDNVLVDREGRVCVGDFGLATLGEQTLSAAINPRWEQSGDYGVELTSTGALVGTPVYMSPQQLRSEVIDARADQFSFCVAAWEALYGARPFPTPKQGLDAIPDLAETIERGVLPDPPPGSRVPDSVREALARGLAADPDKRWSDMAALVAVLERAARRAPTAMKPRGARWPWLVASVALTGALVTVLLLQRQHAPSAAAPPPPVAKKLYSIQLRTGIGLSPSGKYLALWSDRVQVRDTETGEEWSTLIPDRDEVTHLEIDETTVRYGLRSMPGLLHWEFRGTAGPTIERPIKGMWTGTVVGGELEYTPGNETIALIAPDNSVVRTWASTPTFSEIVVSPNRTRFAYIQPGRFRGRLVIQDAASDRRIISDELDSPTSLTFISEDELLFAMGTLEQPRIKRVKIGSDSFGVATDVYALDSGWFGAMRVHGTRLYFVLMQPAPRTSMIVRSGDSTNTVQLDSSSVSLGWVSPTEFLAWSRTSERVERRTPSAPVELTRAKLDGEPANATMAGDVLIASVRRPAGRDAIAISLSDGHQLWRHQDGKSLAVRCADDQRPPCFAIRVGPSADISERKDEVYTLVPETGELGAAPIARGAIQDLAVNATGDRLLLVGGDSTVREIDPTGKELSRLVVPITSLRSVAYDPRGGFLVSGTIARNTYHVGRYVDGAYSVVSESDDDILSFVRPSPGDGTNVLILARVYAPELWQMTFTP